MSAGRRKNLVHEDAAAAPASKQTPQTTAWRVCLRCDRKFRSRSVFHRLCVACGRYAADDSGADYALRLH